MQTVFIRFATQEDRTRGFYELATRSRIGSFPGEVYQVPLEALRILDNQHIAYRRATEADKQAARERFERHFAAVNLGYATRTLTLTSHATTPTAMSMIDAG